MALSNGKEFVNNPLVYLSARSTKNVDGKRVDLSKPYFQVSRINSEGKIAETEETATNVTGDLTRIEIKTRTSPKGESDHIVLFVADNDVKETYYIDMTFRLATRALFNSLLALESPKGISISIYRSKKGFEAFGLWQNEKQVSWKHDLKDLPQAEVIKDKKGEVVKTDFSDVDSFFKNELKDLSTRLFGAERHSSAAEPAVPSTDNPVVKEPEVKKDEDIPF